MIVPKNKTFYWGKKKFIEGDIIPPYIKGVVFNDPVDESQRFDITEEIPEPSPPPSKRIIDEDVRIKRRGRPRKET